MSGNCILHEKNRSGNFDAKKVFYIFGPDVRVILNFFNLVADSLKPQDIILFGN